MDTSLHPAVKASTLSRRAVQRTPRALPRAGKFFLKGLASKYFSLVGHTVSVTSTQCSHCRTNAAMGNIKRNYIYKNRGLARSHSLLIPALQDDRAARWKDRGLLNGSRLWKLVTLTLPNSARWEPPKTLC